MKTRSFTSLHLTLGLPPRSLVPALSQRLLPVPVLAAICNLAAWPQFAHAQSAPTVSPTAASTPVTELAAITVTGTREKTLLSETPVSIGAITSETIRETAPLHPGQLLGQIPGVAIAVTNGEGHTTAIRQPFTTSPLYLFLEDGIPIRATGFFNHNALYEVNIPMAGGIEVVRGPGSALHGSDAIGGIVNILSRAPSGVANASLNSEFGAFGTWRFLASASTPIGENGGVQLDLNATHTDGWRYRTGYDRKTANLRFDQRLDRDTVLKTIVGVSAIDQQTGANSALPYADYVKDPTRNNFSIAYRQVTAARISAEYERQLGPSLLSVIPYFRDNAMTLLASFNLSSDPRIEQSHHVSYGALVKWRKNFSALRARVIAGLDFDYSPGSRTETNLLVTLTGTGASTVYSADTLGTRIYDYQVTFHSLSPYVHTEFSPTTQLRVTAGLRYDTMGFDQENHLSAGTVSANVNGATRFYGQLAKNESTFSRLSPKLGATYALTPLTHLYASYNFGFRAPSESQLYRAGNDTTTTNALNRAHLALTLKPIRAHQVELGLRGDCGPLNYNLVAYDLSKEDDLVSQRDLATNISTNVNAGRTEHRGLEAALGVRLGSQLRLDSALSYARHRYVDWVTASNNFSGKEIETAPRVITNTRLTWRHGPTALLQIEWVRIGAYWLEASNSPSFGKYPGHDLINIRASHSLTKHLGLFTRVTNAADKRFADTASVSSNTSVFTPGLPRALYGGGELRW